MDPCLSPFTVFLYLIRHRWTHWLTVTISYHHLARSCDCSSGVTGLSISSPFPASELRGRVRQLTYLHPGLRHTRNYTAFLLSQDWYSFMTSSSETKLLMSVYEYVYLISVCILSWILFAFTKQIILHLSPGNVSIFTFSACQILLEY